jgi:hypothetical protein
LEIPGYHFNNFIDRSSGFEILENSFTGIRAPRITHAPFSLPGTVSTTGNGDSQQT